MMEKFTKLDGVAAPMPMINCDTDRIIPARFLKTIKKTGLGVNLFNDVRFNEDGSEKPDFVLNKGPYREAKFLVAGENFGCGSSREHAPWALMDWGFRAIVALSFADIFRNNALKNGLLPISLEAAVHQRLLAHVEAHPDAEVSIDVEKLTAALPNGETVSFPLDDFSRDCLVLFFWSAASFSS